MVDTGVTVNIMPLSVFRNLGITKKDLHNIQINITSFSGLSEKVKGMAFLKIIIGTKTTYTSFFIVKSDTNYNAILERDWLHHNYVIQHHSTKY